MNTARPIVATTTLSIFLHGVVFAAFLLVYGNFITPGEGVGRGIEIQLISSILISDQQETSEPGRYEAEMAAQDKDSIDPVRHAAPDKVISASSSMKKIQFETWADEGRVDNELTGRQQESIQSQPVLYADKSVAQDLQSTNASQQQHSILELLHSSISNNKEYPYLARRQRREGVATVSFVLHPDGTIEDAHLVASSHAVVLDRAALSAVKKIEPFLAAQDYLGQPEKFQIDIEFDLL